MYKNPRGVNGNTPFHLAAKNGHVEICRVIMNFVDDATPINNDMKTPFHYAAENGHLPMCQLLVQCTKYNSTQDKKGFTPLQLAIKNNHFPIGTLIFQFKISPLDGTCFKSKLFICFFPPQ